MRIPLAALALCASLHTLCLAEPESALSSNPLPAAGLCAKPSDWIPEGQAQEPQPDASQQGPGVKLPCLFWKDGPEILSWKIALDSSVALAQAKSVFFLAKYEGEPQAASSFVISFNGAHGARSARFAPGPLGEWTPITVGKAGLLPSGEPGPWRDVSSISISALQGAGGGQGALSLAAFAALNDKEPECVLVLCDSASPQAQDWALRDATRRAASLAAALESIGLRFDVLSDIDANYSRVSLYRLAALPQGAAPLCPKAARALQANLDSGSAQISFGALPETLASRMGLAASSSFAPPYPQRFSGWTSEAQGYVKAFKHEVRSIESTYPMPGSQAKPLALWEPAVSDPLGSPFAAILSGPGYVHFTAQPENGWDELLQCLRTAVADLAPELKLANGSIEANAPPKKISGRKIYFAAALWPPEEGWDAFAAALAARGFDSLAASFSSGFVACHPSSALQTAEGSTADELAACQAACKKAGLKFLIWRQGLRIEHDSEPVAAAQALVEGAQAVWLDNSLHKGIWLCPSRRATRLAETRYFSEVLERYKPDGVVADLRLPSRRACFCEACRTLFENGLGGGKRIEKWPEDVFQPAMAPRWKAFRTMLIGGLLEKISMDARQISQNPGFEVAAIVEPELESSAEAAGQAWGKWCEAGLISTLILRGEPSWGPYADSLLKRDQQLAARAALLQSVELDPWLPPESVAARMAAAAKGAASGFAGTAFFDKGSAPGALLPPLSAFNSKTP